jgi:subfamily B ATP-binding cassette protein MsbA
VSSTSGWAIYKRLLGYTQRYWPIFAFGLFCTALVAIIEVGLIAQFETLIDDVLSVDNLQLLNWVPIILVGIIALRSIAAFLSTYCMEWIGRRIVHELRVDLFNQYLRFPVQYFDSHQSGDLVSRITFNTETVSTATTQAVTNLVRSLTGIGAALYYMFVTSVTLTLTFLIVGPLIAYVVNVTAQRFRKLSHHMQDSMGLVTQDTSEAVEGIRVVKSFGGQDYESESFNKVSNINRQQFMKMVVAKAFSSGFIQFLAGVGMAVVFYVAVQQFVDGVISKGAFVAFFMQIMYLLKPLKDLSNVNNVLQRGIAGAESIFTELDKPTEQDSGKINLPHVRGEIEFDNVCFSYNGEQPVLQNLSLVIHPGETVALVGPSGSGKSTITNLLLNFYQPDSGEIRLDGHSLSDLHLSDLRRHIAFVSQQIVLFNDTIRNNIAYGELADKSEEEIRNAIELAYLSEVVDSLEQGIDTQIGNAGNKLSGGQRQRIAIARALLKNAPILILDEATSALDNESEKKIQNALERLMKGRTTLVIAHRLSTVEKADKIVVLKEGQIVEVGTHQQLLQARGEYSRLYEMQFSNEA